MIFKFGDEENLKRRKTLKKNKRIKDTNLGSLFRKTFKIAYFDSAIFRTSNLELETSK